MFLVLDMPGYTLFNRRIFWHFMLLVPFSVNVFHRPSKEASFFISIFGKELP
jgi:hypothetical protein